MSSMIGLDNLRAFSIHRGANAWIVSGNSTSAVIARAESQSRRRPNSATVGVGFARAVTQATQRRIAPCGFHAFLFGSIFAAIEQTGYPGSQNIKPHHIAPVMEA